MRRFFWIAIACLLGAPPTLAAVSSQQLLLLFSGSAYVGPLDAAGVTAVATYCLRACSAANATGAVNVVNIRNGVTNSTYNIVALASGALDTATLISDLGTDTTCTSATAAGTTSLVLSGCSGTNALPHAGDTFTGVAATGSITRGGYLASCGTFTGGAGTCTMNAAQTFTSSSLAFQPGAYITERYNQSGNGHNCSQATGSEQAQLMLFGGGPSGTVPYELYSGAQYCTATITNTAQPLTISWVGERTASFTTIQNVFNTNSSGTLEIRDAFSGSANSMSIYAGTLSSTLTAADSVWHSEQSTYNGTSSAAYLDGTNNSGIVASGGTNSTSTTLYIGVNQSFASYFSGNLFEFIIFTSSLSSSQNKSLCLNQTGSANSGANLGTTCN